MWSLLALVCCLLVAAGCQTINGIDLNQALLRMMEVQSMEGSGTITLEFKLDDAAGTGSQEELMKALNPLKLRLDHIKQQSPERLSVKGALEIPRGVIPFQASLTPEELAIQVEGAKVPVVLSLAESGFGSMAAGTPGAGPEQEKLMAELQSKLRSPEFIRPVNAYFVNNLPNPKKTTFSTVNETINGENRSLFKVGTELDGTELVPWIKSYLVKLMQDDTGLKAVVGQLYDAFKPVFEEANQRTPGAPFGIPLSPSEAPGDPDDLPLSSGLEDNFMGMIAGLLSEREMAIEVLHTEAKQVMVVLLAMLVQLETPGQPSGALLNEQNRFKAALYIDSGLNVRRSDMELDLRMPEGTEDGSPITGFKIATSFRNWNAGTAVKADSLDTKGAIQAQDIRQPAELLQHIDPKSVLYGLLKEDLHITRREANLYVWQEAPGIAPLYTEDGTAMVRANLLAAQLGLELAWNGDEESLVLTDPLKGTRIQWTIGQSVPEINGAAGEEAPLPAVIHGDAAYVPLRATAEALGAQVAWNEQIRVIKLTLE